MSPRQELVKTKVLEIARYMYGDIDAAGDLLEFHPIHQEMDAGVFYNALEGMFGLDFGVLQGNLGHVVAELEAKWDGGTLHDDARPSADNFAHNDTLEASPRPAAPAERGPRDLVALATDVTRHFYGNSVDAAFMEQTTIESLPEYEVYLLTLEDMFAVTLIGDVDEGITLKALTDELTSRWNGDFRAPQLPKDAWCEAMGTRIRP